MCIALAHQNPAVTPANVFLLISQQFINHKKTVWSEMFAFAESVKRQEIKLISPKANISLLSIHVSAQITDNCYSHV